jgi:hypothetical protein
LGGVLLGIGEAEVDISSAGIRRDAWNMVSEVGVESSVEIGCFPKYLFDFDLVTNLQMTYICSGSGDIDESWKL